MKSRQPFAKPASVPVYVDDEPIASGMPTFTLDRQIASARKDMGEQRWSELNGEWA